MSFAIFIIWIVYILTKSIWKDPIQIWKLSILRFFRRLQTASKFSKNTIWYSLSIFDAHHLNSLDTFYHGDSKRREDVIPDNQKDNVSVWWVRKEKTLVKQNYMKEEEKTFTNQSHYPHWLFSLFNFVMYDDLKWRKLFSEMNTYEIFFKLSRDIKSTSNIMNIVW